jgi:hypothetical protein
MQHIASAPERFTQPSGRAGLLESKGRLLDLLERPVVAIRPRDRARASQACPKILLKNK